MKHSVLMTLLFFMVVGCSSNNINPDELEEKLFTLNSDIAIIDLLIGKVDNINPTSSDFLGSERNIENSAVNGILNELHIMEYSEETLKTTNFYYLLIFDGQMIEETTDTFEIYLYVNPDNNNLYLDKIQLGYDEPTVEYNRLYKPNDKVKQYVDDILEVNQ